MNENKDIVTWGIKDIYKLISSTSSSAEGWMTTTKAMQAGTSVVVLVTTNHKNPNGSYSFAESLTTVDHARIIEYFDDDKICTSRKIVLN